MEAVNESIKKIAFALALLKNLYVESESEKLGEAILCIESAIDILSEVK